MIFADFNTFAFLQTHFSIIGNLFVKTNNLNFSQLEAF